MNIHVKKDFECFLLMHSCKNVQQTVQILQTIVHVSVSRTVSGMQWWWTKTTSRSKEGDNKSQLWHCKISQCE